VYAGAAACAIAAVLVLMGRRRVAGTAPVAPGALQN
jgi:hypothetical protein